MSCLATWTTPNRLPRRRETSTTANLCLPHHRRVNLFATILIMRTSTTFNTHLSSRTCLVRGIQTNSGIPILYFYHNRPHCYLGWFTSIKLVSTTVIYVNFNSFGFPIIIGNYSSLVRIFCSNMVGLFGLFH
jgi:hypothetical protein